MRKEPCWKHLKRSTPHYQVSTSSMCIFASYSREPDELVQIWLLGVFAKPCQGSEVATSTSDCTTITTAEAGIYDELLLLPATQIRGTLPKPNPANTCWSQRRRFLRNTSSGLSTQPCDAI